MSYLSAESLTARAAVDVALPCLGTAPGAWKIGCLVEEGDLVLGREAGDGETSAADSNYRENHEYTCECNLQHHAPCVGWQILGTGREKEWYLPRVLSDLTQR